MKIWMEEAAGELKKKKKNPIKLTRKIIGNWSLL